MKPVNWRIIVGLIILVIGGLALLQSLEILKVGATFWDILVPACFAAGGLGFLYVLITSRYNWWAAIPGFTLLGLGIMMGINRLPGMAGNGWSAAIFMGFIGLGFLVIFS